MARIDADTIKKINDLYLEHGVKSRVAKLLGISAATVTKYLIEGYGKVIEEKPFEGEVNSGNIPSLVGLELANFLLQLTEEEKAEMIELQKEVLI